MLPIGKGNWFFNLLKAFALFCMYFVIYYSGGMWYFY